MKKKKQKISGNTVHSKYKPIFSLPFISHGYNLILAEVLAVFIPSFHKKLVRHHGIKIKLGATLKLHSNTVIV